MRTPRNKMVLAACLAVLTSSAHADGVLKICLNEDAPPYSASGKNGESGFDLEVSKALARQLGRKLEVQWFESKLDEDSSGALEANALLSDGLCQLVAGYPMTEDALGKPGAATARLPDFEGAKPADRRRRIPLGALQPSLPYHFAPLTIVLGGAAVDKRHRRLGDLDGVKIGVEGGTLSDTILMIYGEGRLIDDITAYGSWPRGIVAGVRARQFRRCARAPASLRRLSRRTSRHQIAGVGLSLSHRLQHRFRWTFP